MGFYYDRSCLRKGNKLRLDYPLSPADVKKIRGIYDKAAHSFQPLSYASYLGLFYLARAFIECAKQTNTNLHTGETGDGEFQKFLWLTNENHKTALDVAIEENHVEIAELLLKNASLECLISDRNYLGQLPVSMLTDPQHDNFIFEILEVARRKEAYPPTSTVISIDDHQQQGSLDYNETTMSPLSYPVSNKHGHGSGNDLCMRRLESGLIEVTPNKNTILHLVSACGDVDYVKEILKNHSSLLYYRNSEGETAAYVAAREGHVDILAIMIYYFKKEKKEVEPLVTRDMDKHTALHIAIQNHHVGVVFWLIQEIPQLINCVNDFGEIPHFLAAERGLRHILYKVFHTCNQRDFTTSNGKTTLHAAAICGSEGCIWTVVQHSKDLLYRQDKDGWTPLFYAIYHNHSSATTALLNEDHSIGYKMSKEDDATTSLIYIATSQGHCDTLKILVSKCPGCLEITYGNGRNILHFAIENKKLEVIKFMFSCKLFTSLINKRDGDGNTPIHLFMKSDIEMMEIILDSRVNMNALNNENHTPLDVSSSEEKRDRLLKGIRNVNEGIRLGGKSVKQKDDERKLEEFKAEFELSFKIVENIVLVATLIATATFASVFSVPGGFDGNEGSKNQGMPILLRKAAYKAFVVTNTIAFSCSCSVLIGYIMMLLYRYRLHYLKYSYDLALERNELKIKIRVRMFFMYLLTGVAMITMAVAFVTGIYVVLTPSLGLAISLCLMSLFIMISMSVFPTKTIWNRF